MRMLETCLPLDETLAECDGRSSLLLCPERGRVSSTEAADLSAFAFPTAARRLMWRNRQRACIGPNRRTDRPASTPLRAVRTVCEVSRKTAGPEVRQTCHRMNRSPLGTLGAINRRWARSESLGYHPWGTYVRKDFNQGP